MDDLCQTEQNSPYLKIDDLFPYSINAANNIVEGYDIKFCL